MTETGICPHCDVPLIPTTDGMLRCPRCADLHLASASVRREPLPPKPRVDKPASPLRESEAPGSPTRFGDLSQLELATLVYDLSSRPTRMALVSRYGVTEAEVVDTGRRIHQELREALARAEEERETTTWFRAP